MSIGRSGHDPHRHVLSLAQGSPIHQHCPSSRSAHHTTYPMSGDSSPGDVRTESISKVPSLIARRQAQIAAAQNATVTTFAQAQATTSTSEAAPIVCAVVTSTSVVY